MQRRFSVSMIIRDLRQSVYLITKNPTLSIINLVIGSLVGIAISVLLKDLFNNYLSSANPTLIIKFILLIVLFLCILGIFYVCNKILLELDKRVGPDIKYFHAVGHNRENLFHRAEEVVSNAEHTIYVVTSPLAELSEEYQNSTISQVERRRVIEAKESYYRRLLELGLHGVEYLRIVQVMDLASSLPVADPLYITHYHQMLEERTKPYAKIGLSKSVAKRYTTFVLVDNKWLLWQINETISSNNVPPTNQTVSPAVQMQGLFVIYDPSERITEPFRVFFETLRRTECHPVQKNDLPTT